LTVSLSHRQERRTFLAEHIASLGFCPGRVVPLRTEDLLRQAMRVLQRLLGLDACKRTDQMPVFSESAAAPHVGLLSPRRQHSGRKKTAWRSSTNKMFNCRRTDFPVCPGKDDRPEAYPTLPGRNDGLGNPSYGKMRGSSWTVASLRHRLPTSERMQSRYGVALVATRIGDLGSTRREKCGL
jgi:hypothetical protein